MVAGLAKPGQAIIDSLTEEKADLLHMVVGVAGEAGELVNAIKKHVIYNKPVDRDNVVEELGDLEFYMERIRQRLGITRQETIQGNVNKLGKRYAGLTYSDNAAQQRADKKPAQDELFAAESEGGHND
jgi:NTP pyrophosphatase (non-canonical NTP hydrolase)